MQNIFGGCFLGTLYECGISAEIGWIEDRSRINIIFFGDVGDDTLRCIFSRHLCFFSQEGNVTPLTPIHLYTKYHISTCFFDKDFYFSPKEKISYFLEKRNTIFPDITKKIMFRRKFFGKTIFWEHLKKISYFHIFFWERSSFNLCLNNKIIFLEKRNIIFPDNTRKIIFQRDFFGKTIFSKHLEKENMVFRAVLCLRNASGSFLYWCKYT